MDRSQSAYNYIASQCQIAKKKGNSPRESYVGFVTISRQAGAGGITIGEKLIDYLNQELPAECPWAVFDKNLVYEVIKEHSLSDKLLLFLKEEYVAELEDIFENMLGLHPPQLTLIRQTTQTIQRLARMGRVVIVGRGATVVTKGIAGGVHVRLIGSFKKREEHIKDYFNLTDKEAAMYIEKEDHGREQYLKKYFDRDINDPLLYDLVINTDNVSYDEAAQIISGAVVRKITSRKESLIPQHH